MDQYAGEIRVFPYKFIPEGWKQCWGQYLPIEQYQVLFAVIGTAYGGDGHTTFKLPNMLGRVPVGTGQRIGGSNYNLGNYGGYSQIILSEDSLPEHKHQIVGANIKNAASKLVTTPLSDTCYLSNAVVKIPALPRPSIMPAYANSYNCTMNKGSISIEGGGQAHDNMMPYMEFVYCICVDGDYPPRP